MKSKSLWLIGLVIVLGASLINGLLIQNNIGGIARELVRVLILTGIAIFIIGLIRLMRRK